MDFLKKMTFCLVSTIPLLSNQPNTLSPDIPLYYGSLTPRPIIHPNGSYAWSGVTSNGAYSPNNAFYHANGKMAWGGLCQERLYSTSDKAFFYYENGAKAWGGIHQYKHSWISDNGKFHHYTGELAWGGVDQTKTTGFFLSDNGKFFHAGGELAWNGVWGGKVYYPNGQVAWNGGLNSAVYDQNGRFVTLSDYVYLHLGFNSWLYIESGKKFELILNLGQGINLRVKKEGVTFDVQGVLFDLNNDF